jgi:hypothetical protein
VVQRNQEIKRPAKGREQVIPQIDAEIVNPGTRLEEMGLSSAKKKGHFWMETK